MALAHQELEKMEEAISLDQALSALILNNGEYTLHIGFQNLA